MSDKKHLFVEAFDGDELYAMRVAGFTGPDQYLKRKAEELLKDPTVIAAIKHRDDFRVKTGKAIADREERQALWTAIMRNNDPYYIEEKDENGVPKPIANIPLPTRLKASELLGKSEADFVDKIDLSANVTITDIIAQSYLTTDDDESIEDIEAEYTAIKNKEPLLAKFTPKEDEPTIDDFV